MISSWQLTLAVVVVCLLSSCRGVPPSAVTVAPMESKRPVVLVTHWDVPQNGIDLLKKTCDLRILEGPTNPTYEQIKAKVKGVDAIFWISDKALDKAILDEAGPQLKAVATMSAGVNKLDIPLIKSRGIKVANTPGVVTDATANVGMLLALAAGRRLNEGRNAIVDNTWTIGPQWLLGHDITGSKVGIVGLGGIGQTLAKRLKAFDVSEIMYTGHKEKEEGKKLGAKFVDLNTLVKESDYIFVAVPLTNETEGMFNSTMFKKMKKTAVFINISRGQVVVQEDLIKALKDGTIFAAGLDVMTPEPLPKDHELLSLPNCILTPHIGTATFRARREMAELTANNLLLALEGKPMLTPV